MLIFHMWEPYREMRIARHAFYVEQARTRLLSQFDNMEAEADKAAEDWLERDTGSFNPDADPASLYELAHDKSIEFYTSLAEMREQIRLSLIAGMYHEWEKQLRDWLVTEINHWHGGPVAKRKIWGTNFEQIFDLMDHFGWAMSVQPFHATLDACRLVTNVFKHGDGSALRDLKLQAPQFLQGVFPLDENGLSDIKWRDHTHLKVDENDFTLFADAITAFWRYVPEHTHAADVTTLPRWFEDALEEDRKAIAVKSAPAS